MLALQSLGEEGAFLIKENDIIRGVTAEESQKVKSEFGPAIRLLADFERGVVRFTLDEYDRLPLIFIQSQEIYRQFLREQDGRE